MDNDEKTKGKREEATGEYEKKVRKNERTHGDENKERKSMLCKREKPDDDNDGDDDVDDDKGKKEEKNCRLQGLPRQRVNGSNDALVV